MTIVTSFVRFLLRTAWLLPVAWMYGGNLAGSMGVVLPVMVLIAFGTALIFLWPLLSTLVRRLGLSRFSTAFVIGLGVLGGTIVAVGNISFGVHTNAGTYALEWLLLLVIGSVAFSSVVGEQTYPGISRDFILGTLGLLLVVAFSYTLGSRSQMHFGALVYAGFIGYVLLGVAGLGFARRYAPDEFATDMRSGSLEPDWLLTVVLLIGGLGIASLVFAQLFAFDIMGAIGHLTQPLQDLAIQGLKVVATSIAAFLVWLIHILGIKPRHHAVHPTVRRAPQRNPIPSRHLHSNRVPSWILLTLEALLLAAVAIAALSVLTLIFRSLLGLRLSTLKGERRVSEWSWRKMTGWLFRQGQTQLRSLLPEHGLRLPRRRRLDTVRDVYRAFLHLGGERGRARVAAETGLEYSLDVEARWPASEEGLDRLNAIYMAERYGLREPDAERVAAARAELERFDEISREP